MTHIITGFIVFDRVGNVRSEMNSRKVNPRAWSYIQVFPSRAEASAWRRVCAPDGIVRPVVVISQAPARRRKQASK